MGQIIDTNSLRQVVESNVRSFVAQVTGPYSRLLAKTPTFTSYYSQDLVRSTLDVNLGGVIEFAGPSSPLKFIVVRDFPLYGITEADVTSSYSEINGVFTGEVQGDVVILPGTITPVENDFFTIQHLDTFLVFRISQVSADRVEGKSYYKLHYFLDQTEITDLDPQISERKAFEIQNLGTGLSPIVSEDISLALRSLKAVVEKVRTSYIRAFHDSSCDTIMLKGWKPKPIHDRALELFIQRTNVLSAPSYLGAHHLAAIDYSDNGFFEDTLYPNTIYFWKETGVLPAGLYESMSFMEASPLDESSAFFTDYAIDGYLEGVHLSIGEAGPGLGWDELGDPGDILPVGLGNIASLAAKSIRGEYLDRSYENIVAFTALLNDTAILSNRKDFFWYGPIVLHEAKLLTEASQKTTVQ
jgi:hypothetical protein